MDRYAVSQLDQDMLGLGERLVLEFDEIPAGSVLRCLARAFRKARSQGIPAQRLPAAAEARAPLDAHQACRSQRQRMAIRPIAPPIAGGGMTRSVEVVVGLVAVAGPVAGKCLRSLRSST